MAQIREIFMSRNFPVIQYYDKHIAWHLDTTRFLPKTFCWTVFGYALNKWGTDGHRKEIEAFLSHGADLNGDNTKTHMSKLIVQNLLWGGVQSIGKIRYL